MNVFRCALIAGIVAGFVFSGFHVIMTERVIDEAIVLEEALGAEEDAGMAMEEEAPIVTRDIQKVGLVLGLTLYGLAVGVLAYGAHLVGRHILPRVSAGQLGVLIAVIAYWSFALAHFIKYPSNPPGVGDPETIDFRQTASLAMMMLTFLGAVITLYMARRSAESTGKQIAWPLIAAVNVVFVAVLFLVMPANTDPTPVPNDLLMNFRALSIIGMTVFWGVFGAMFGWLLSKGEQTQLDPAVRRAIEGSAA